MGLLVAVFSRRRRRRRRTKDQRAYLKRASAGSSGKCPHLAALIALMSLSSGQQLNQTLALAALQFQLLPHNGSPLLPLLRLQVQQKRRQQLTSVSLRLLTLLANAAHSGSRWRACERLQTMARASLSSS